MTEINNVVHDLTMLYLSNVKILSEETNFNEAVKRPSVYAKLYAAVYSEIEMNLPEHFRQGKKG